MPKKLNITAKIAPDVLLQEFKSKEFYFFALKISLFRKYVSYFKYRFDTPESLTNKGIKEKPIEMSYHKGSDFNRFFNMAAPVRLELTTHGLTVRCSTD